MPSTSRLSPAASPSHARARDAGTGGLHNIAELARRSLGCKAAVVRVFDRSGADAERKLSSIEVCAAAVSPEAEAVIDDFSRLSDPLVADDLGFRFYAGIPLRTPGGQTLGVLAAVDHEARQLADGELETLNLLAAVAAELAEARFAGRS